MSSFEDSNQQAERRLREGTRDGSGILVAYLPESGNPQTWTGDEEAPYVKAILIPGTTPIGALDHITSGATAVSSLVVLAEPGRLFQAYMLNTNAAQTRYLMILDATSASAGAVPVLPAIPACPSAYAAIDLDAFGIALSTGIVLGCSSDPLTFTAATDAVLGAQYL